MSFIPDQDELVCTRCGACGFSYKNCLNCQSCVYCKQEGHIVDVCPKAQPCGKCGKKGHPQRSCPQMRSRVFSSNAPKVLKKGDMKMSVDSQKKPKELHPMGSSIQKTSKKRKNEDSAYLEAPIKPKQPKYERNKTSDP